MTWLALLGRERVTRQMNKTSSSKLAALCGSILLAVIFTAAAVAAQTAQPLQAADHGTIKPQPVSANVATATTNEAATEVESLKHRVEEVENQNRTLMRIVTELKARLDATAKPDDETKVSAASATVTRTAMPAIAQTQTESKPPDKNQPVRWSDLIGEGNKFKMYGFLSAGHGFRQPARQ